MLRKLRSGDTVAYTVLTTIIVMIFYKGLSNFFLSTDFLMLELSKTNPLYLNILDYNLVRPIGHSLSWLVMSNLFGLKPLGYHVVSLLLLVANTLIVFRITETLFKNKKISFISSLFYGTRTAHLLPIFEASLIFELEVTFFIFLSFLFFLKMMASVQKKPVLSIAAVTFYIAALLSKESALSYPLILGAYLFIFKTQTDTPHLRENRKILLLLAPYLAVSLVYVIVRFAIAPVTSEMVSYYGLNLGLPVLKNGLIYLLWCFDLNGTMFRELWYNHSLYLTVLVVTMFLLVSGGACYLLKQKGSGLFGAFFKNFWGRYKVKWILFSSLWFPLALSTYLLMGKHMFPYYLSFSLLGPAIVVGFFVNEVSFCLAKKKDLYAVLFSSLFVILTVLISKEIVYQRQNYSWVTRQARIAKNIVFGLKEKYNTFPPHSQIVILGNEEVKLALYEGSALRVFYNDFSLSVLVTGDERIILSDKIKKNIYFFRYEEPHIIEVHNTQDVRNAGGVR